MISSYSPASRTASSPWWWENDSTCCICAPALEICDARIGPTCRFIKQRTKNRQLVQPLAQGETGTKASGAPNRRAGITSSSKQDYSCLSHSGGILATFSLPVG